MTFRGDYIPANSYFTFMFPTFDLKKVGFGSEVFGDHVVSLKFVFYKDYLRGLTEDVQFKEWL